MQRRRTENEWQGRTERQVKANQQNADYSVGGFVILILLYALFALTS